MKKSPIIEYSDISIILLVKNLGVSVALMEGCYSI